MKIKTLKSLNQEELKKLKVDIDAELDNRDESDWKAKTKNIYELLKIFGGYGFVIPTTSKFYRINGGKHRGCYGYQVGRYTHSCHVDTTDFIVLLVHTDEHRFVVDNFDSLHLGDPMIVI